MMANVRTLHSFRPLAGLFHTVKAHVSLNASLRKRIAVKNRKFMLDRDPGTNM